MSESSDLDIVSAAALPLTQPLLARCESATSSSLHTTTLSRCGCLYRPGSSALHMCGAHSSLMIDHHISPAFAVPEFSISSSTSQAIARHLRQPRSDYQTHKASQQLLRMLSADSRAYVDQLFKASASTGVPPPPTLVRQHAFSRADPQPDLTQYGVEPNPGPKPTVRVIRAPHAFDLTQYGIEPNPGPNPLAALAALAGVASAAASAVGKGRKVVKAVRAVKTVAKASAAVHKSRASKSAKRGSMFDMSVPSRVYRAPVSMGTVRGGTKEVSCKVPGEFYLGDLGITSAGVIVFVYQGLSTTYSQNTTTVGNGVSVCLSMTPLANTGSSTSWNKIFAQNVINLALSFAKWRVAPGSRVEYRGLAPTSSPGEAAFQLTTDASTQNISSTGLTYGNIATATHAVTGPVYSVLPRPSVRCPAEWSDWHFVDVQASDDSNNAANERFEAVGTIVMILSGVTVPGSGISTLGRLFLTGGLEFTQLTTSTIL
jgi:hypothetical protein